eukprot:TRINITY_DN7027_c0_g2_i7.p1 TRINITY_DN7027_c0_g2~~TRINITY_DN7027_c0_g2_i7.p1  ORF type:complete len:192 (-),score=22.10 TRINITY_DN7027_c0_g2_i7:160-735(-)
MGTSSRTPHELRVFFVLILLTSPLAALPSPTNSTPNGLCAPGDNPADCHALCELFWATGSKIPGFANGSALCGWTGVFCDSTPRVTALDLANNGLSGTVPDSLGSLAALQSLDLDSNSLSGTVPDSLGSLAALQSLYLATNALSGTVPDSLGSLAALQFLFLNSNSLSRTVPDSLGSLAALQSLYLSLIHI